jgi:shikimate dehydrogenase
MGVHDAVCSSSIQPILALIALPVAGNPAQFMFERAFAYHGLDWRYLSLEVADDDLADAVRGLRALGFRGGNCAEPHKSAVLAHLDRVTETAAIAGTANCLFRDEGGLTGDNTEGRAVVEAVQQRGDIAGRRVVLLGAGQLARAVAVELALAKVEAITIVSRSESPAAELAATVTEKLSVPASAVLWDGQWQVPAETGLVIAATPLGTGEPEDALPLRLDDLAAETIVADASFSPPRTWLLDQAAERGCPTVGGLEIFIRQAAINFRRWTDVEPEPSVLREAVEEFLEL